MIKGLNEDKYVYLSADNIFLLVRKVVLSEKESKEKNIVFCLMTKIK